MIALGKKTGGRDFKQGTVPNPEGRPKLPEDIKESRQLNQAELERIMNRLLILKPGELSAAIKSGELSMMELTVAMVLQKAAVTGDQHRLDFILNRIIGKVKEKIEIEAPQRLTSLTIKRDKRVIQDGEDVDPDEVQLGPNVTVIHKVFGPDAGETLVLGSTPVKT